MKYRYILYGSILAFALVALLAALFFLGFKNYGKHGNWNEIISFNLPMNKDAVENLLLGIPETDSNVVIDNSVECRYAKGWYLIKVLQKKDTIEYLTRFRGDSAYWIQNQNTCEFDLMGITTKTEDITESTKNKIPEAAVQKYLTVFRDVVILRLQK